jgi:hypothetical protein
VGGCGGGGGGGERRTINRRWLLFTRTTFGILLNGGSGKCRRERLS